MTKARILQIVALIILLLGFFILFEHLTNEEGNSIPLGGIGVVISGIAILIISIKVINQK